MADIFISYSRGDRAFMLALRDSLLKLGFNVWVDVEGLTVGTPNWAEAIDAAIRHVDAVVVVLTPSARGSEWVNKEIIRAQAFSKPILPVLAGGDERSAVPFTLAGVQYADMRGDKEAGFRALVADLGGRVGWDIPAFSFGAASGDEWGVVQAEGRAPGKAVAIGQDLPESTAEQQAQQERRLEAAMPHRTRIGSRTECRVKISLPDSKGLRGELPAVTLAGDLIRKGDVSGSTFPCVFPVEERTGRLLPATLCVKVTSGDFTVRGETRSSQMCGDDQVEIALPPDHDSGTIIFELSPVDGQQAGRSRVIVTVSDGKRVLAQTAVVTELVREVDPLKEITWNLVSLLMQATSAPLAAESETYNITVGGGVASDLNGAGRDIRIDQEKPRERGVHQSIGSKQRREGAAPPAPPAQAAKPQMPIYPAQASRKSSGGWGWLLVALVVVALIVLVVLAISSGWFGG